MKKILLILFLLLLTLSISYAKVDTDFDINEVPKNIQYCKIIGTSFGVDTPPIITLDFGQKWIATKYIKKDGKKVLFNSMIETLNFMYENGWEFVDFYILTGGFGFRHHYILKRRN